MTEVNKGFNRTIEYLEIVKRIHAHGIAVQAGIVFGFDHDTPEIFEDTIDFLEKAGVQNATFNILTPFPGTPLFRRMEAEGRILTRDWRKYNSRDDVVYQPRRMSIAELLAGVQYANERFYSFPSMAKRLSRSWVQLWWTLPLNLAYGYRWRISRATESGIRLRLVHPSAARTSEVRSDAKNRGLYPLTKPHLSLAYASQ